MQAGWIGVILSVAIAGCGRFGYDEVPEPADGAPIEDAPTDAAIVSLPASCNGLVPSCGPTGSGSCCDSPRIAAGTFARTYDVGSDAMFPDASFVATLSAFRLDKYEVTVSRFRKFVSDGEATQARPPLAGAGAHPHLANSGWDPSWNANLTANPAALAAGVKCLAVYQTWTDTPGANEERPIVCVTWYEAMAFCAWDGGFLPTEAEWNYAASGGDEQRAYPWSSPPGALAIDETRASWNCTGDGLIQCLPADLVNVGSRPAGDARWGQSDLAGNADEWTLDWKRNPYATPCVDCAEQDPSLLIKVFRGGTWGDASFNMRGAYRGGVAAPVVRQMDRGFRCARAAS